jgi:hypothetical protein
MTMESGQILDNIRKTHCKGRVKALIPRDSRHNVKEREAVLQIRYAQYEIKKPQSKKQEQGAAAVIARAGDLCERGTAAHRQ